MYDIIGDVHGQAGKLRALLAKLGYRVRDGAYRHPQGRQALFLGDLIDRGPEQIATIDIVRRMIDAGTARSVMGNHEWNAIGFFRPGPNGGYLRARSANRRKQHDAFLRQVGEGCRLHQELVEWFATLPVTLDLSSIRLCHAWWDPASIGMLRAAADADGVLAEDFLVASYRKDSAPWLAMERVTKGCEIALPTGVSFRDHNDIERREIRVRWWDDSATAYRQAALVPEREREGIPDLPLPDSVRLGAVSEVPTFVGHYWLSGRPGVQSATIAVLDYGAAIQGPLVAYRWDGEPQLSNDKLVWVAAEREMQP